MCLRGLSGGGWRWERRGRRSSSSGAPRVLGTSSLSAVSRRLLSGRSLRSWKTRRGGGTGIAGAAINRGRPREGGERMANGDSRVKAPRGGGGGARDPQGF